MQSAVYEGGFAHPPVQSAAAFRAAMEAMARPGTTHEVTGGQAPGLSIAASVLLLVLCDADTGLWLAPDVDSPELRAWVAFHCGAPIVSAERADFALGAWGSLPIGQFAIGTPEYPDRSVTLIVEGDWQGTPVNLTGPGIETAQVVDLPDPSVFTANAACFPLGWDAFFTRGDTLWALPRSSQIQEG